VDKLWTDCLKEVNSVWVVDDVVTTGSTMNQVFNCLSEINPKLKLFGVGICGKRF
jgi:predicted amidophosphoribosyltransferase